MACYAAVSSLVNLLSDIVHHDRDLDIGIGRLENIESLLMKVKSLQGLLRDHSIKCNKAAEDVQRKIRDLAYKAQDMIQYQFHHQMIVGTPLVPPKKSERFILYFKRLVFKSRIVMERKFLKGSFRYHSSKGKEPAHDVQSEIRDIIEKEMDCLMTRYSHHMPSKISNEYFIKYLMRFEQQIGSLVEDLMSVEEGKMSEQTECSLEHLSPHASASDPCDSGENSMIGFNDDMLKIKEELCGQSYQLRVIPIVGMGGIGKTTLATHVFKDSLIVQHFDFRGWITISQDYNLEKVLQSLMKSLHMEESHGMDEVAIYKHLKGRKYLIIIDDIWSTNVWDDLKRIFPNDSNGSRILLTSRLEEVASYCGSLDSPHRIQFLNENESWNLLQNKVFALQPCPPELEDIGKLIAKNCHGLPLAIVVIAGVLSKVKTQHHWKEIERNMVAKLSGNEKDFSNVLSLSYNHLPHHLKACFLYIGRFPEDYEIKISRLINLWIAEGFIELSGTSKRLEEVAEEYLEDLIKRSLILVTKRKAGGKFKYCVMHDLLRAFCKEQGLREQFFHVKNDMEVVNLISRGVRRINVHITHSNECIGAHWRKSKINESLRSIIWFGGNLGQCSRNIFCGFMLLETLDLLDLRCCWIPEVLFRLIHLKYLALKTNGYYISIPQSISKLQNLQTFIIFSDEKHKAVILFPTEIWELAQLRHLMTSSTPLRPPPCEVANGGLENLQTLSIVENFTFTDGAIRMIPNLRRLKVHCSSNGQTKSKWKLYQLCNLVHLRHLEKLRIYFFVNYTAHSLPAVDSFPANFAFPLSLKELCLIGTGLLWKDLQVVGSLPNLKVLKLASHAVIGDEWEPVEGEFLQLKFLMMELLPLRHWQADSTHFPCLEHLSIRYCHKLIEIPLDIGEIPTLRLIDIVQCSKGVEESALQIQEEQKSMGNDVQVCITRRNW